MRDNLELSGRRALATGGTPLCSSKSYSDAKRKRSNPSLTHGSGERVRDLQ
jgi:hypothetical protein